MTELKMPCETWTRTVGYFRPVSQSNKGKQEEIRQRIPYKFNLDETKKEKLAS